MPNFADFNGNFADYNAALIEEFRSNGGVVTGEFAQAPLVLITTTGAKSGQRRTTPLVHTKNAAGDVVIIASKGGAPNHPHWYLNILANPQVSVELPGEAYEARARVAPEPEREQLYRAQAALMPNFAEYEKQTDRTIPVVVLERV
jgi:deazaflavin-dependent oxidoreductase (nitroreductase family)